MTTITAYSAVAVPVVELAGNVHNAGRGTENGGRKWKFKNEKETHDNFITFFSTAATRRRGRV